MKYNLTAAISIVIANMIGTGVFTSLGFQLFDLNNISSIAMLWILGGIIAVLGSFCYAELSSTFPRSGGEYHFLRLSFGKGVGFLSGWTSAIVGFAAPIAASAYAFAIYFSNVVSLNLPTEFVAIAIVIIVTIIHSLKIHIGAGVQVFFTTGKILLLVSFIIAGLLHSAQGLSNEVSSQLITSFDPFDLTKSGFWISLIFVSYAYSGWNASAYIIDEIENPVRNVPRSIFTGTLLVTILYVLINVIFMLAAPISELKGKPEVAHAAAKFIFGPTGASIVSCMVSFFLISTIGSMIIVGPRVMKRMAGDYKEFNYFAKENANNVPVRAIILQSGIAILLLLTSSFEFIITAIGFILSIFTTLTAIGLIILRIKEPQALRSIKVPLYPLTPLLFVFFNLWTIGYLVKEKYWVVMAGFVFLLIGYIIYRIVNKTPGLTKVVSILIICSTLFHSCSNNKTEEKETNGGLLKDSSYLIETNEADFSLNKELDQRAEVIAGLNEKYFTDEKTIQALSKLNENWEKKNKTMLSPIKKWAEQESIYKTENGNNTLIFYPFSGPDFEFVNAFYSEADEYIMCGLEKAGNKNSLLLDQKEPVDDFIRSAKSYFYFSDRLGFFRTIDMGRQFRKRGVADIIALYIKRAGGTVGEVKLYKWDPVTGTLKDSSENIRNPDICSFVFRFPSGKVSKLYYFEKDVSDNALEKDSLWLNWVKKKAGNKKIFSLTKSASYLMQSGSFEQVKSFILNNSKIHIQDDTGISFSAMNESGKELKLYGEYSGVIPVFNHYFQKDMAEKYKADSLHVKKLPFRIGYNLQHHEACLQVLLSK